MKLFSLFIAIASVLVISGCSNQPGLDDEFAKSHGDIETPTETSQY